MPALFTTMLSLPKLSTAQSMIRLADLKSVTLSKLATASPRRADFLYHVLGRRARLPGAVEMAAEIVHDDFRAVLGEQQRLFASDAAAAAVITATLPVSSAI